MESMNPITQPQSKLHYDYWLSTTKPQTPLSRQPLPQITHKQITSACYRLPIMNPRCLYLIQQLELEVTSKFTFNTTSWPSKYYFKFNVQLSTFKVFTRTAPVNTITDHRPPTSSSTVQHSASNLKVFTQTAPVNTS